MYNSYVEINTNISEKILLGEKNMLDGKVGDTTRGKMEIGRNSPDSYLQSISHCKFRTAI